MQNDRFATATDSSQSEGIYSASLLKSQSFITEVGINGAWTINRRSVSMRRIYRRTRTETQASGIGH